MWDILLDALIDSSIAAPFLLVIYLLIEWFERNARARASAVRLLNGKLAPLIASGVGLIPQCGFSVMATDLYCQRFLRLGTLIAFFVATSDEALPILLTNKDTVGVTWIVLLVKVVYAVILGYAINLFDKRDLNAVADNLTLVEDEHEPHDHSHDGEAAQPHSHAFPLREGGRCREATDEGCDNAESTVLHLSDGCCHHGVSDKGGFWSFVKHPLLHTLKIFVYIFVVNAVFGLLLDRFGQAITDFTAKIGFAQSFVTAAIGLIPNCASSVIITGMYADGIVDLPALLAGLVSNSGIALAVLFKDRKHIGRNFAILGIMYLAGVLIGIPAYFLAKLF